MFHALKRVLCIFLAVIMAVALFAGCAKQAGSSDADSSEKETSVQASAETSAVEENDEYYDDPSKKYTIEWLGANIFEVPEDAPIKKWMEEKYNVQFNLWFIDPKNKAELFNLKLASNEIPDIWMEQNRTEVARLAKQGIIAEVPEEVIRKYAPEHSACLDKIGPVTWFYNKIDGKNFAIPGYNNLNAFPRPIIWRGDWLEKVGITSTPKTLAEFETAFYKFINDDPNSNGTKDTYALSNGGLNSIFGALGYIPEMMEKTTKIYGKVSMRDGNVVYGSVQPEMKEALALLSKWYKDGVLDPEWVTGEFESSTSKPLVNGRIGYTSYGNFYHYMPEGVDPNYVGPNYTNLKKLQGDNANMVFGTPPVGPDGKSGTNIGDVYGIHLLLGKQLEEDKGKMARILKIVNDIYTDEETFLTSRFGFEGEHWNYDENKNIIQTPDYHTSNNLEKFSKTGSFITFFWFWTEDTYKIAQRAQYDFAMKNTPPIENYRNAIPSGMLPSIAKSQEELFKLTTEAYTQIIMGNKDISYFDEYVNQWRKAGGDILEKEANELYAEYQKVSK